MAGVTKISERYILKQPQEVGQWGTTTLQIDFIYYKTDSHAVENMRSCNVTINFMNNVLLMPIWRKSHAMKLFL